MRSAGTGFLNKSLRFKHCSHKQRGGEKGPGCEKTEKGFFSQLQGTKTWRGKRVVGPPPNLPTGDKSPSAELCNFALTTIQPLSLQRSVCGAGRWTPASWSRCVICLINLINIHTALDCSQKRGQSAPFPPIAAWWVISQKRADNMPQALWKFQSNVYFHYFAWINFLLCTNIFLVGMSLLSNQLESFQKHPVELHSQHFSFCCQNGGSRGQEGSPSWDSWSLERCEYMENFPDHTKPIFSKLQKCGYYK